jgi:zinc protease
MREHIMNATRKLNFFLGGILIFSTPLPQASAQTSPAATQKQSPPPGGAPKPFNVPANETYALPNGLRVTLVPYGNIPKVDICVSVRAGNVNDPRGLTGIADITGELLKEGTKNLSAKDLAETIAGMGSSLDLRVAEDETAVDVDVLSEYDTAAVKLLADFAMHPLLPESELPRLKANLQRQVMVAKTRPGQIALARFRKLMYGDHPYGDVLPTEDSINKITIDDARKFYAANYGAERAHVYVAGKFDVAKVKKAIAENFSSWPKGASAAVDAPKPKTQRLLDVTDRPNAPQSTIYVGLPVADATNPDNIPLIVTNSLLGGSFGSRITSNIREQKGYTYSPTSQVSRRYHDAYWAEIADVTTASTGPSLKEIFGEIERLQKEPPSAAELKGIQSYLSGVFVIQNSTRQALIGQLRYVDLQGLGEDYLKTFVQKVNAVTPDEVQRMTAKYIKPDQMTIVVVGDKSKITEQLAPFAGDHGSTK